MSRINEEIIINNKFPMVLGGEHSLTPGSIKPIVEKFGEITLLHFDAHADLRESYQGEKFLTLRQLRCLDNKK